jgi:hypothetical protein
MTGVAIFSWRAHREHLQSVHSRHHDVQNDGVVNRAAYIVQRLRPRADGVH